MSGLEAEIKVGIVELGQNEEPNLASIKSTTHEICVKNQLSGGEG